MRDTLRDLLSAGLKDNPYLTKAVVTGILRVAKESIFSGLNNPSTSTVLSHKFSTQFGFTPEEVKQLLAYYDMEACYPGMEQWYNGYCFGNQQIYNPWSILSYLEVPEDGLKPYWVNTSGNELVRDLILQAAPDVKDLFGQLLAGKPIESPVVDHTVFADLEQPSAEVLYSFLVFSGYLKAQWHKRDGTDTDYYHLLIPNREVATIFRNTFDRWLRALMPTAVIQQFTQSLLSADIPRLQEHMQAYVLRAFSYHDVPSTEPERVYHGFILGLLAHLDGSHLVQSNREAGFGRADVLIIPQDPQDVRGYVLELRRASADEELEAVAQEALGQIVREQYSEALAQQGKTTLCRLGMAFRGKEVCVAGATP